jgi:hypothetical protein
MTTDKQRRDRWGLTFYVTLTLGLTAQLAEDMMQDAHPAWILFGLAVIAGCVYRAIEIVQQMTSAPTGDPRARG